MTVPLNFPHIGHIGRRVRPLVMMLCLIPLVACGGLFQHADTTTVAIKVSPDANENSAIEVDVVAIYDTKLLDTLLAVPARQWFAQKQQYALDYPNGTKVWNWQLVPGQIVPPQDIATQTSNAYGVLVFANYRSSGDHRARIGSLESVSITLEQKGFVVTAVP